MVGDTRALIRHFSLQSGIPRWKVQDYVQGRPVTLKAEHAALFVIFYNQNRHAAAKKISTSDLLLDVKTSITEDFGLKNK